MTWQFLTKSNRSAKILTGSTWASMRRLGLLNIQRPECVHGEASPPVAEAAPSEISPRAHPWRCHPQDRGAALSRVPLCGALHVEAATRGGAPTRPTRHGTEVLPVSVLENSKGGT